jgi:hypothetical protein
MDIGKARAMLKCTAAAALLLACSTPSWGADRPPVANAQSATPCAGAKYRQFDFWVGDWDVFDVERPAVVVARARVELILNGCVLHEVYEGLDGHKGESFTIYDATRDTWHQSWVNDHGYLLTIEGSLQGSSMILQGTDHLPNGKPRRVRGEWRPHDHGVREVAARSTDGGTTWVPWFDLLFLPHRPLDRA